MPVGGLKILGGQRQARGSGLGIENEHRKEVDGLSTLIFRILSCIEDSPSVT